MNQQLNFKNTTPNVEDDGEGDEVPIVGCTVPTQQASYGIIRL